MDGYVVHGLIAMPRGAIARIEDGKGMFLYPREGELWITQEGDRRDYFIAAGRSFRIDRDGAVLVYALRRGHVTLTAPVETYYARRVSLVLPGVSAPSVIYDRSKEPGGWLGDVRQRLARLWTNLYARTSNPSTATF